MSKYGNYEVGDKFIIEIGNGVCSADGMRYFIKGFNTLVFDDNGLNKLKKFYKEPITQENVDRARVDGFVAGKHRRLSPRMDRRM